MENEKLNDSEYEILSENYPNRDLSFKILLIGNIVGKSCLSNRAIKKKFNSMGATICVDAFNMNIRYQEKVINLQIFDTPGQNIYKSLICNYFKEVSLVVMVYAINE